MKKTQLLAQAVLIALLWSATQLMAQVPKKVVVEHFTNTVCSVCASRNPGFYTNLNNQSGVLHIAVHPSSPYASCKLNKHNTAENDARTNYYGIYGSTPRFVIQGNIVPSSANINAQSLFDPYLQQTSPLAISTTLKDYSATELMITVSIKTVELSSIGPLVLTASVVEESLYFASPNGEQVHHDVFRKSFFEANGQSFTAASQIGDSVLFEAIIAKHAEWNLNDLYALVMVQQVSDKKVIQAEKSAKMLVSTGMKEQNESLGLIYPNPTIGYFLISLHNLSKTTLTLYDHTAKIVLQKVVESNAPIDLTAFANGLYTVVLSNDSGTSHSKLVKATE